MCPYTHTHTHTHMQEERALIKELLENRTRSQAKRTHTHTLSLTHSLTLTHTGGESAVQGAAGELGLARRLRA